ncbi:MotA/TolQ/ExbB proton channel family protein [Comamonadaceae bacterium BS-T2-15]|uniref:Biopolymer transport protein ExbB n=2 Tax=Scleromatobacter humisilvae TaxID=2897159 RepID=A0A9X2C0J8_9BURK|nr:MotA/TolQ/ExbB proton channel family protein [Scleromatobacter humisilvae]MCK9687858.1 MotA/TolQ/ExbB proton channel family protein [Scleromatobacter humisilvae]
MRTPFAAALLALATVATAPTTALAQASAPADATAAAPAAPAAASDASATPAPAAADTGAAPIAPAAVGKETIENPYGLGALWRDGGWIAKFNLIIMLIMSMGSWYIIFTKYWEQRKMFQSANGVNDGFWTAGSIKAGTNTLDEGSAFRYIAESGLKSSEHHEGTLVEQIDRHTWISMSVSRAVENIQSRLSDGLAFLATVGSTAPFVGLFGTVWGIYGALTQIGIAGQASIDKVAGPVGEALIMTAIGLAVAVPAVMGYNWLVRRNKSVMEKVRAFSGDLHNVLLAGKR